MTWLGVRRNVKYTENFFSKYIYKSIIRDFCFLKSEDILEISVLGEYKIFWKFLFLLNIKKKIKFL